MNSKTILGLCLSSGLLFAGQAAMADEAEDNSADFEATKSELAATLGIADPGSTITTHENGMTSATVGLSALKLLVVSQDEDGNLTYAHVASDADEADIAEATEAKKAAEE